MASHQHKRPYAGSQPSITSYFPHAISPTSTHQPIYSIIPSSNSASHNSSITQSEREHAQLSASIQSNLLSVGMRVRKSVPEGYKTGSYSAFTLFSDEVPAIKEQPKSTVSGNGTPVRTRPRARELTPFCGILKVGGLAQQNWGIYDNNLSGAAIEEDEQDDDYMPALSQGSTISNDSISSLSMPGERKRRLEFDDEGESEEDQAPSEMERVMLRLGERAIAIPRRKKAGKMGGVVVVGQENGGVDVDFEEADFLDYGLMDDSEMGGV